MAAAMLLISRLMELWRTTGLYLVNELNEEQGEQPSRTFHQPFIARQSRSVAPLHKPQSFCYRRLAGQLGA
jgi:hypothetical protein